MSLSGLKKEGLPNYTKVACKLKAVFLKSSKILMLRWHGNP